MFAQTSYTVLENAATPSEVCVELQGELDIPVTMNVGFQEETATSDDFSNIDLTYTFIGRSPNAQCFQLIINEEDILENDEIFTLSLTSSDDFVDILNENVEVHIQDTSEILVGFESDAYTVTEGNTLSACARIFSGRLAEQLSLPLTISSVSGQGKEVCVAKLILHVHGNIFDVDLIASITGGDIEFVPPTNEASTRCASVLTQDDQAVENAGLFVLMLTSRLQNDRITIQPLTTSVTVDDNDSMCIT